MSPCDFQKVSMCAGAPFRALNTQGDLVYEDGDLRFRLRGGVSEMIRVPFFGETLPAALVGCIGKLRGRS